MRYRFLGRSGLKVSELCLGTMTFGEETGIGAKRDECARMFERFAEAGGNFVDTANIYTHGSSERFLAEFMGAERHRWVLASKFSMTTDPKDPNAGGNSRKNLHQALDASLERLGTDYIDLYWVHAWDRVTPIEELWRGLDDAVRAGKILYVGFSNVPAWVVARAQTMAELRGWAPCVALQLHYSLIERTVERELLPAAAALGMAVTAWSPLAGGLLTGKYAADAPPAARETGRLTTTNWGRLYLAERNLGIAATVLRTARRLDAVPAAVALRWLVQRREPVIPIIGARSTAQLAELLTSTDLELDATALAELEEASRIDLGYPAGLLNGPVGTRMVHGESAARTAGL